MITRYEPFEFFCHPVEFCRIDVEERYADHHSLFGTLDSMSPGLDPDAPVWNRGRCPPKFPTEEKYVLPLPTTTTTTPAPWISQDVTSGVEGVGEKRIYYGFTDCTPSQHSAWSGSALCELADYRQANTPDLKYRVPNRKVCVDETFEKNATASTQTAADQIIANMDVMTIGTCVRPCGNHTDCEMDEYCMVSLYGRRKVSNLKVSKGK